MKLRLKFTMDNAAFADGNAGMETARILRELANRIEHSLDHEYEGPVMDVNGNHVGTLVIK